MHVVLVIAFVLTDPTRLAALAEPAAKPSPSGASAPAHAGVRPATTASRPVPTTKRLRIAGYVALGLGSALFGTMGAAAVDHVQTLARLERRAAGLAPGQRLSPFERSTALRLVDEARDQRTTAIATGVAAAASLALAATFFVLARGRERSRSRLALAPTWLPAGAGLTLHLRLR